MSFWKKISGSVYNPAFYREIARKPFSDAFGFFLRWVALLSVIATVVFVSFLGLFLYRGGFSETVSNVKSLYPEDLVVTIDKGRLSVNQDQPYAIPAPVPESGEKGYSYVIVFDTEYPVTAEAAREYDTFALVGETSVGIRKNENEFRVYEIPKDMSYTVDREFTDGFADMLAAWVKKYGLAVAAFVIVFGLLVGLFFGVLVYAIFAALLVWLAARIKGVSYTYAQAYAATLYLAVAPQSVATLVPPVSVFIPFFRTISVFLLALANIKKEDADTLPTSLPIEKTEGEFYVERDKNGE